MEWINVFIFVPALLLSSLSYAQESCTDSTGRRGSCQEINECSAVLKDLTKFQPTICRWDGVKPIICCTSDSPAPPPTRNETPRPPFGGNRPPPVRDTSPPRRNANDISYPGCGRRGIDSMFGSRSGRIEEEPGPQTPHIVGGIESKENAWPWMAGIYVITTRLRSSFLCGGTVISRRYVLSAAHCFAPGSRGDVSPSNLTVLVGANSLLNGRPYRVERFVTHDYYRNRQLYHDIALVRVDEDFAFSKSVAPACLPPLTSFGSENLAGKTGTVTGWGDKIFGGIMSKTLREVGIPVVSNDECGRNYSRLNLPTIPHGITRGQLCAGFPEGGRDACQNDSGGPMVMPEQGETRWIVVGIVSFGRSCAQAGFPGVYTRVSRYMPWVARNTDLG